MDGAAQTNTDGAVATDAQATPETPTDSQATDTANDSAGKDVQARINALTAQLARKDKQLSDATSKMEQLIEAHKSEDEKRLDALVTAKIETQYGEKLQRVDALEATLAEMATAEIAKLPEGAEGLVDMSATPEVRLRQALTAQAILANTTTKQTAGTGPAANPAGPGKPRTYSKAEFREWQEMANSADPARRKQFKEMRDEMKQAYHEGRIV